MRAVKSAVLSCAVVGVGLVGLGQVALAGVVLYSSVPGSATSQIPGQDPGVRFGGFDRPNASKAGTYFGFLASVAGAPDATRDVYFVGTGLPGSQTGQVIVREGVTEIVPGRLAETLVDRRFSVNESGQYAMKVNTLPTGVQPDDEMLIVGSGGTFSVRIREGQQVPLTSDPSVVWGSSLSDVTLSEAGQLAFRANSVLGLTAPSNHLLLRRDGTLLSHQPRNPNSLPDNSGGVAIQTILAAQSYQTDQITGEKFLFRGTLNTSAANGPATTAATSNVIIIGDGLPVGNVIPQTIVMRQGITPIGSAGTVSNFITSFMNGHGDWFVRGETSTQAGYAVRNGEVIALTGEAVPGGLPGETWGNWRPNANGNTFSALAGNGLGEYVIAGFTTNPDTSRNVVWVHSTAGVFFREGDPVDLDGNGLFDDDAFFMVQGKTTISLNNQVDNLILTDDGRVIASIDLKNGAGQFIGQAVVSVAIPEPASATLVLAVGGLLLRRRR